MHIACILYDTRSYAICIQYAYYLHAKNSIFVKNAHLLTNIFLYLKLDSPELKQILEARDHTASMRNNRLVIACNYATFLRCAVFIFGNNTIFNSKTGMKGGPLGGMGQGAGGA